MIFLDNMKIQIRGTFIALCFTETLTLISYLPSLVTKNNPQAKEGAIVQGAAWVGQIL